MTSLTGEIRVMSVIMKWVDHVVAASSLEFMPTQFMTSTTVYNFVAAFYLLLP